MKGGISGSGGSFVCRDTGSGPCVVMATTTMTSAIAETSAVDATGLGLAHSGHGLGHDLC